MGRRPKSWKLAVGPGGARVVARERAWGGNVWLYTYDRGLGGSRKRTLGFPVRDAQGALVPDAVERARREALALSNRLIEGAVAPEPKPEPVTLGALVDLFRRDVLPGQSPEWRAESERELALWLAFLGARLEVRRLGAR